MVLLLKLPLPIFLLVGLGVIFVVIILFALLFAACGADCFSTEFDAETMLWFSAHTFVTMGNSDTHCGGGQLIIVLEFYAALIVQLVLGAVIVVKAMTPRANVRFATNALISVDDAKGHRIVFRLANESRYGLKHATADVRVMLDPSKMGAAAKHKNFSPQIVLPLVNSGKTFFGTGDHWVLCHNLDADSPLVKLGALDSNADGVVDASEVEPLLAFITWLDVGISVFDPVYHQPVLFSKRYGVHDIVSHADWADMLRFEVLSKRDDGSPEVMGVTHDHALLDAYVEDGVTKTAAATPPPMLRERALRWSPYSLYS